jgi:SAM-dependent methyltransferase
LPFSSPPDLTDLADALARTAVLFARVDAARDGMVVEEGGDVGGHGSNRLVTRHVANYLAAVDLAGREPVEGSVVDVGSGVGALGVWAAELLGAPLHLVDRSATARAVAARAFPQARVEPDVTQVPPGSARLVTGMEVIEHVPPTEQAPFVRQLVKLLAPGGMLVLSTPDETGYVGGWSGYRPHVGPLSFRELEALLARNAWEAEVWRLEGPPFALGRVRAVAEPAVNRVWGTLEARVPEGVLGAAGRVGRLVGGVRMRRNADPAAVPAVYATSDADGPGTGLLGVVRRPAR